ncbi:MAG: heavy metal translocating P-type ATPase [Spirochaetaceae bacterium]|jgi:Cd2+/Zn2+-exporting ATPase|nr:heavy metal translocating P-type ATPase [Spirochaetaceae bacterium]
MSEKETGAARDAGSAARQSCPAGDKPSTQHADHSPEHGAADACAHDGCCSGSKKDAGGDSDCCAACAALEKDDADDEGEAGRMVQFGSYALPLKRLVVFGTAFALWGAGLLVSHRGPAGGLFRYLPLAPFLAAYALAGLPVLKSALKNIMKGKAMDENFLMSIATIGAFAAGEWEEAAGVMIFYMIGELVQEAAVSRSRRSIKALLALKPGTARVRNGGVWTETAAARVAPGDEVLVRPGERIPVDGVILEGSGAVDASMLSGESRPVDVRAGSEVQSGTVSIDSVLILRALRTADNSQAAKIVSLVESAREAKARPERFITAFAKWYTPIVVCLAVLTAILPPVLVPSARFADWFYRALILLVISCPCALVVSSPLGYFAGIGGLSRRGIMVKGAVHLDSLHRARHVAFDKTGTLTRGNFAIKSLETAPGTDETELLQTAVYAERESNHPIARAITELGAARGIGGGTGGDYRDLAGHGILAGDVLAGNRRLLEEQGVIITAAGADDSDTAVYIAKNGVYLGRILIGDTDREGSAEAIARLKALGIRETVMFTGDARRPAEAAAQRLGIRAVKAELLPRDKLTAMDELVRRGITVFVGDGINDAPVLARSDVGIAMGSGADAAVEAADVIIMTDDPRRVPEAIERARRTRRIVVENTVFALGTKGIFIALTVMGMSNMWFALIADVGVALIAIVNAARALR